MNITHQQIILWCHQGLVNPTAVYSAAEQTRLAQKTKLSDKTVLIRYRGRVSAIANTATATDKTWHYKLKMLGIYHGHHQLLF
jgi:hypothetical protein